jgi:hypothetical protein
MSAPERVFCAGDTRHNDWRFNVPIKSNVLLLLFLPQIYDAD